MYDNIGIIHCNPNSIMQAIHCYWFDRGFVTTGVSHRMRKSLYLLW